MARSSTTSSSEGRPIAGLIALALCVAAEIVFACTPWFLNGIETVVEVKRGWLRDGVADDVVLMGDSRFFSIPTEAVSEALGGGLRVTNMAWPAMGVEAPCLVLESLLAHKPPPRLIIIGFGPDMIGIDEHRISIDTWEVNRERAFTVIPAATLVPFLWERGQISMIWMLVEHRLMPPSVHHRAVILSRLHTWLWDWDRDPLEPMDHRFIDGIFRQDRIQMRTTEQMGDDVALTLEEYLGPVRAYPNEHARAMAERFARRASEANISVLVVEPPVPEAVRQIYDERGVSASFEQMLRSFEARWPSFHLSEPVVNSLPNELFGDPGHVNAAGNEEWIRIMREACAAYRREVGPVRE